MVVCLLVALGLLSAGRAPVVEAASIEATWTGGAGTTSYDTAGNWNVGEVPINDGNTYDVIIDGAVTVNYDVDPVSSVTDLSLGASSSLIVDPGTNLSVLDDARIAGIITVQGGTFTAGGGGAQFTDNRGRLAVTGAGTLAMAATQYSPTTLGNLNVTLLSADGAGSLLDLSSLTRIDDGHGYDYRTQKIEAVNQGVIDLSGVGTLTGPTSWASALLIHVSDDGNVLLPSLTGVSGYTRFDVDVPAYTLGALATASETAFDVAGGSTMNAPVLHTLHASSVQLADGATLNAPLLKTFTRSALSLNPSRTFVNGGLEDIDDSTLAVSGGRVFGVATGDVTATEYSCAGRGNENLTVLSANGAGSLLDLSSLTRIDDGHGYDYRTQKIEAVNQGVIDLSGVGTLTGPTSWASALLIHVSDDGNVLLPSLTGISGYTGFDVDVPGYTLGALATASETTFDVAGGSTVNVPALHTLHGGSVQLADGATLNAPLLKTFTRSVLSLNPSRTFVNGGLEDIDDSTLAVSGGRVFGVATGDVTATEYSCAGRGNENLTVLSANGAGSLLDLSSLTRIEDGHGYGYRTQKIEATNQGIIDLSGVGTLTGPTSWTSALLIHVSDDGNVLLPSLTGISGYTRFDVDVPGYTLGALATASETAFDVAGGSTVNTPALHTLHGGSVALADGATLNAPLLKTFTRSALSLNPSRTFVNGGLEDIDDSTLAVSGGRVFGVATGDVTATEYSCAGRGNENLTVLSANGAGSLLDLSSLTRIDDVHSYGYRTQKIEATNQGVMDLSGVSSVMGPTNGTSALEIRVSNEGTLKVGSPQFTGYVHLYLKDPNALLDVGGSLALEGETTLSATNGAAIEIGAHYTFAQQDVSAVDLDTAILRLNGTGPQMFEVGGADLGLGGATEDNFGLAQMVVGTDEQPTTVLLVDLEDNGNRSSNEALYLYGSGGLYGLRVRGGSTLVVGDINVYALWQGEMVHINELFGPEVRVPFDDGWIAVPEPGTLTLIGLGGVGLLLRRRRKA